VKLLNQFDVAKLLGISQAKYSLIENGYKSPTPQEAQKLIAMFGLKPNYFEEDGSV
jgi:transcriptional regulator with XRE-family HTH domain